jgi:hypothetical protein
MGTCTLLKFESPLPEDETTIFIDLHHQPQSQLSSVRYTDPRTPALLTYNRYMKKEYIHHVKLSNEEQIPKCQAFQIGF